MLLDRGNACTGACPAPSRLPLVVAEVKAAVEAGTGTFDAGLDLAAPGARQLSMRHSAASTVRVVHTSCVSGFAKSEYDPKLGRVMYGSSRGVTYGASAINPSAIAGSSSRARAALRQGVGLRRENSSPRNPTSARAPETSSRGSRRSLTSCAFGLRGVVTAFGGAAGVRGAGCAPSAGAGGAAVFVLVFAVLGVVSAAVAAAFTVGVAVCLRGEFRRDVDLCECLCRGFGRGILHSLYPVLLHPPPYHSSVRFRAWWSGVRFRQPRLGLRSGSSAPHAQTR